ncbi:MAG: LysR family transcriptional regulator [Planctomycetota bacterium]|nr:LysR family transcriptional regulator [Planctomycetota bacterium]
MLTLQRLQALKAVGEEGSFTKAAEKLFYSQSAVSQHIAALESYLKVPLVNRQPRGISLTQAGRILSKHADVIFQSIHDAERDLAALSGASGGELRIATFPTASSALMPRAISMFHERHPDVKIFYSEMESEESLPKLLQGDLDLAIVFDYEVSPLEIDPETLHLESIIEEPLFIALPKSHHLAGEKRLGLKDLKDEPWIGGNAFACSDSFLRLCIREGFQPNIVFGSDDYATVQGLIAHGMGIAMMPALATLTVLDELVTIPLCRRTVPRRVHAAFPVGAYQLPAARALLDILIQVAPEALEKTAVGKISKRDPANVRTTQMAAGVNGSK